MIEVSQSSDCTIYQASSQSEAINSVKDSGFNYPLGLMNFTLHCQTAGATATVTQYYYQADPANLVLRKYNPNTHAYSTILNPSVSTVTLNNVSVAKVSYSIKDGGPLDTDGDANSVIVDPVGLGSAIVGAPNTGLHL